MKILITGAKGQLGNTLSSYYPKNMKVFSLGKKKLDITNLANLKSVISKIRPNIIINTAGFTKVDLAEDKYQDAYRINSIGPKNLSKIIKDLDIFLIHISTECVFDGNKVGAYTEIDRTNPVSKYGETKLLGEKEIIKTLEDYMIFRVSWLYGPKGKNFVFKIIDNIKKKKSLAVVNDQFGRPTSTLDFSSLIWKAVKKILDKNYKTGIYNYSDGGQVVSRYEMAKYIVKNLKKINFPVDSIQSISSSEIYLPAKRLKNSSLSLNKTLKEFNIKETNWKNSILEVIRGFENEY